MSADYSLHGAPARLEAPILVSGKRPVLLLYCAGARLDDAANMLAKCLMGDTRFHAIIPLPLARRAGLIGLLSAFITAYVNHVRGCRIARIPGLDTLLYLQATRNLRDAIKIAHELDNGVQVIVAMDTPSTRDCLTRLPPGSCTIPYRSSPREETRQAVFAVDAKACKGRRQDTNSL